MCSRFCLAECSLIDASCHSSWHGNTFCCFELTHPCARAFQREVCILIFETLRSHLLKARTWPLDKENQRVMKQKVLKKDEVDRKADWDKKDFTNEVRVVKLKEYHPFDLEPKELEAYREKQNVLNRLGVTSLLAHVIRQFDRAEEDSLPDVALELLNELLFGGNKKVQDTLYDILLMEDIEGKFMAHIAQRLKVSFDSIVEGKKLGSLGGGDEALTAEVVNDMENAVQTLSFMECVCQGHNLDFQELLREQPMCKCSTNPS